MTDQEVHPSFRGLALTPILDEFARAKVGDTDLVVRATTGQINMSSMCSQNGRELKNWICLKSSQRLIEHLILETGMSRDELLFKKAGGRNVEIRGTYMPPPLATHVATWISAKFGAKMSMWIEDWKTSPGNQKQFWNAFAAIEPDVNDHPERDVRDRLAAKLDGQIEVACTHGFIDILTGSELIEVKCAIKWKSAVGQLLAYQIDYPDHSLRMHLFDCDHATAKAIRLVCTPLSIRVTRDR